jgi:hypothetical protein
MMHVWHIYSAELKAGRGAIEAGGAFIRSMIDGARG